MFHLEAIERGSADYGIRLGIAAAIGLIMLVGGRIVPSFTHNWLVRNNPGRLPRQFARFDALVLGTSALVLGLWVVLPQLAVSGVVLIAAAYCRPRALRAGPATAPSPIVSFLCFTSGMLSFRSASSCSVRGTRAENAIRRRHPFAGQLV